MKIAVCVKQVVTREWQLRVNEQQTWIRDQDASFELNEPMRPHLHAGFKAFWKGDPKALFEEGVAMGYIRRPDEIDPDRFLARRDLSLAPLRPIGRASR